MTTERIKIIVTTQGAVTVKKELSDIGTTSRQAASGVDFLKGALTTLISAATIQRVIQYGDSYTRLQNSLRVAGLEGEQLAGVQERLLAQANRNGTEVESLAQVYSRASIAGKELGASQESLEKLTSGVAAAIKISGQSATAARGPMLQLAQALGSPIVRAEEFNSIMEGMLPVAQAAARGIDGFEGSVSKLRLAVVGGEITNRQFFEGLIKGFAETEELASRMSFTVGQAFTILNNQIMNFVGQVLNANGIMGFFADAIVWVAFNLDKLLLAISPLIAALTVLAVQAIGSMLIGAMTAAISTITTTTLMMGRLAVVIVTQVIAATVGAATALASFGSVLLTTVIPAVIRFTAALLMNPLFAAAAVATLATLYAYKDAIAAVGEEIVSTTNELINLQELGKFVGDTFTIDLTGQQAATAIESAMRNGASAAASAISGSGASAGRAMGEAAKKPIGVAAKDAATVIRGDVETGGNNAAGSMKKAVSEGGANAAESFEAAGVKLTGSIINMFVLELKSLVTLQMQLIDAQINKLIAESNKLNAEARAIRTGKGGGGGGYSPDGEGRRGREIRIVEDYGEGYDPYRGRLLPGETMPGTSGEGTNPGTPDNPTSRDVTINNIISPREVLSMLDSNVGRKMIINAIRLERDDVQEILGVV